MILESFDYAEEDFRQRQIIEARNEAENILAALEKGRSNPAWQQLTNAERKQIAKLEAKLKKASPGDVRLNGTVVSHEGDAASASGLRPAAICTRACSVAKLTAADSTPGTASRARSTRPAHDAQVMPVTARLTVSRAMG